MEEDEQVVVLRWWAILFWALLVGFLARLMTVWMLTGYPLVPSKGLKQRPLKTLIVLGSGGHTAEILHIVEKISFENYSPRCYIAAVTDNHSLAKAKRLEEEKVGNDARSRCSYYRIYRSREVGQSYITSIGTTLLAMAHAFYLAFSIRPDVILCNGPGTCLPVCIAGFVLKVLGVRWVVMVYVESIARVKKLSLTGVLFYKLNLMDQFFVQWPKLQQRFPRTQYVGRLM